MTIVAAIILVCWIGCVFQAILGLILMPRLQPVQAMAEDAPLVSVIIPARDEERAIESTLRGFLAQEYSRLDVILVDDQSVDRTTAIASEIAASDSRLRVVSGAAPPHGWLGKPWAHLYLPGWLSNRVPWSKLAIGGGTGMPVRRSAYDEAGGHEPLRNAIVGDVSLARIVRKLAPTIAVRADDLVSVRIYDGLGEIVRGFTKIFYFVPGGTVPLALGIVALTLVMHVVGYVWAIGATVDLLRGIPPAAVGMIGLLTIAVIALARLTVFVPLRYDIVNAIFAHPLMSAVWIHIGLRSIRIVGVRRQLG